jgi:hypothetical protein
VLLREGIPQPHRRHFFINQIGYTMSPSTWVIVAGIALLLVPIPPFATIAGAVVILFGLAMKKLG